MERLVGEQSPLSHRRLHLDSPRTRADRYGGRHDVPLRHRRSSGCARKGKISRSREGRATGWRREHDPTVFTGRLIDEIHVAISPVMLGKGEHLLGGIATVALGYVCTKHVTSPNATHFVLARQP